MKNFDPVLTLYIIGGIFLVLGTYLTLSLLSEWVKDLREKDRQRERIILEERRRKEEEKIRKAS